MPFVPPVMACRIHIIIRCATVVLCFESGGHSPQPHSLHTAVLQLRLYVGIFGGICTDTHTQHVERTLSWILFAICAVRANAAVRCEASMLPVAHRSNGWMLSLIFFFLTLSLFLCGCFFFGGGFHFVAHSIVMWVEWKMLLLEHSARTRPT